MNTKVFIMQTGLRRQRARFAGTLMLATMVTTATPAEAGNHWLSRVHVVDMTGTPHTIPGKSAAAALARKLAGAQSANATFDIVVSLQENPQGDDNATVDSGPGDDAQNEVEARIREFANAVFEATNGAHKIGRVTIYREYRQRSLADVQWEKDCTADQGPWSHVGGFQKSGLFIHFCTNWPGSRGLSDPRVSGFALAHEWSHYAYNLYDEFPADGCAINLLTMMGATCPVWQPRATDIGSDSLMHDPWYAAANTVRPGYGGNSADYLEYSTPDHAPYSAALPPGGAGRNGHERVFAESVWQTLTRNPDSDPSWPGLDRIQYTNLSAPAAPNWRVSGGTAGALTQLDIRWVGSPIAELSIDRSGSMAGVRIVNALLGAGLLVKQLLEGETAIGVASFSDNVSQDFAIADIESPDTVIKAAAIAAINALNANGATSLYDALMDALARVSAFQTTTGTTRDAVVYVLSDGQDNDSSVDEADVIAAFQNAGVPIVAFGYGPDAPTGTLLNMASATGGRYYQSPTTLAEIAAVLVSANTAFSNKVLLTTRTFIASANAKASTAMPVDSTLEGVSIGVTFDGEAADVALRLLDPSGADTGATFTCDGTASCAAGIDSVGLATGGLGDYAIEATNTTGSDIAISVIVSASPKSGQAYDISVDFGGGATTNYPTPMIIRATVRGELPISGLTVTAQFRDPANKITTIPLRDDGGDGDAVADDGTYTGGFHYVSNGVHTVIIKADNAAGNAQTSTQGGLFAMARDGTLSAPVPTSITEGFIRTARTTTVVENAKPDDHSDTTNTPAACTAKTDDNVKTPGRIDYARDIDCFFLKPSSTSASTVLVARVTNLSNGMSPTVKLYNTDGTTLLLEVPLSNSDNPEVGTITVIPATVLSSSGHVVTIEHGNGSSTQGNYAFSVGQSQISDLKIPDGLDDGIKDLEDAIAAGGLGPWTIAILALLALVGLRQRRLQLRD